MLVPTWWHGRAAALLPQATPVRHGTDGEDEEAERATVTLGPGATSTPDLEVGDTAFEDGVKWTVRSIDGPNQVTWEGQVSPKEMEPVDPAKRHECRLCRKRFSTSSNLVRHATLHSGIKPHECRHCGKEFQRAGTLLEHHLTHAENKPPRLSCVLGCGKMFANHRSLATHARNYHGEPGGHRCKPCDAAFNTRSELETHQSVHPGAPSFACKYCGKTFNRKGIRGRHQRGHEVA